MKKLEELKELTSVNLKREFAELENAVLTTIQSADRCEIDLMFMRFSQAHRSATLLRSRTVDRFSDGLITVGELGGILSATDQIVYADLADEIKNRLKMECKSFLT